MMEDLFMSYLVAKVENGVAYLWGESFALVSNEKNEDGWYFVKLSKNEFKDKKGVNRQYVSIVAPADDKEELKRVLNIYYGYNDGIKDLINNYYNLVPAQIRSDSRFKTLCSLVDTINYSSAYSKEHEMSNFVSKVCCIVAGRIIKDKFVKKETEENNEVSE